MKITVYTFAEDTDSGTDSTVFGTVAELHAHMKQVMLASYNHDTKNPVVTVEPDGKWTTRDDVEQDTIALINSGDVSNAFLDWQASSRYRDELDTYNFDEEEIEVPEAGGCGIVREFLNTFAPLVAHDEYIPGTLAVDKIVAFVHAMHSAPSLVPLKPLVVTIEVTGGVAEATDVPEGVEVKIVDHDNE